MSTNNLRTFASQKIGKIRWKPEEMMDSEYFITGSIDEEENQLTLWHVPAADTIDEDSFPVKIAHITHCGDVTALKFVSQSNFLSASSLGNVTLLECSDGELSTTGQQWDGLHYLKSGELVSCTDIASFEEDITSVGEDGRLVLLNIKREKPIRVIDGADSCPLQSVCFLKHNEIVTGNIRGQLKIWDLLSKSDTPMSTFMPSGEGSSTMCVINHPSQQHLMLAGSEDGAITVWDLRKSTYPVNELNAHTTAVAEMKFHPERLEHLFTCSFAGELWQWNTIRNVRDQSEETVWLSNDAAKHRMEVNSLMPPILKPINSLDVSRSSLVCGSSDEAIYLIKKLAI